VLLPTEQIDVALLAAAASWLFQYVVLNVPELGHGNEVDLIGVDDGERDKSVETLLHDEPLEVGRRAQVAVLAGDGPLDLH